MPSSTKVRRKPAPGGGGVKKRQKRKAVKKRAPKLTAKSADKYELYQLAVNSPEADVEFLMKTFERLRGREPRHLREDFCGTAALAAEWISQGEEFTAEGFDLDPEPIEWGKRRNFEPLGEEAMRRMTFHRRDVRSRARRRPDVTSAPNFSYWLLRTRKEMLEYFRSTYRDLAKDGLFVLDLYGGPDAFIEMEEVRRLENGVQYVWDQIAYRPASGEYDCAIHFRFRDGSEMRNAFEYTWRFWHLTELKDLLLDAGFRTVDGYFEGSDEDNPEDGNGIFEKDEEGENIDAWIAYLVAAK